MNVLITGSSGFLGSHLAEEFIQNGHNVCGISRAPNNRNLKEYPIDINNFEAIRGLICEKNIDYIVHAAGKPIVSDCEKNPYEAYKINGLGTSAILEAAKQYGVKKVVSIETDKVYGYQEIIPTHEELEPKPTTPYEFSKYLSTMFSEFYRQCYGMNIVSVRPANIFGSGDLSSTRIIPRALANLKSGQGILIYNTALNMKRDFIYVKDAARAIYLLTVSKCQDNVYNLSDDDPITIKDLADRIISQLNLDIPHQIVSKPDTFQEIPLQEIDGARFKFEFDFKYKSFEEAIQETWDTMQ